MVRETRHDKSRCTRRRVGGVVTARRGEPDHQPDAIGIEDMSSRLTMTIVSLTICIILVVSAALFRRAEVGAQGTGLSSGPPMPFEDVGACPFECCVYREWVAKGRVTIRADRRASARTAFSLGRGDRVQAITGIVVTLRPGRVQFREAVDMGAIAGAVHSTIHVEPSDTLYLLTYRGEGETAAWFKGRLYDLVDGSEFFDARCEDNAAACNGMIREKPQTVWWIRLRTAKGLEGWPNEPEKFDNKDACS